MSIVQVQVMDQGQLDKMQALLAGIPNGTERAAKSAMQRAVSHLRTNSAKAIQEKYDISTANIRANESVFIRYSYQDGVQAFVTFAGGKIPLFHYGGASPGAPAYDQSQLVPMMIRGQWRMAHPGVPVHGHQRRDTAPALFEHAFVARMGSGHVGIFARDGGTSRSGGDSISEIMGGTVPGMLGKDEVKEKLGEQAAEKYMERYHHEVMRLLNGWGG
ncbi:MAG: hypothetical protein HFE92_01140 [Acutalibacter muris]|nr:hypothetical protein [Acutalibacter muris]